MSKDELIAEFNMSKDERIAKISKPYMSKAAIYRAGLVTITKNLLKPIKI